MNERKNDTFIKPPKFDYDEFLVDLRTREAALMLAEKRYLEFLEQNRAADKIKDKHPHNLNSCSDTKKFAF